MLPSQDGFYSSTHTEICRIINDRRAKALAYLVEIQTGHRVLPDTPAEKIAAAREFMQQSTVGAAALGVWHATNNYHAWSKRADWLKWNEIGVSEVMDQPATTLSKSMLRLPRSTGFRWSDRSWVFALENSGPSYSRDKDLGKLRVSVDGKLVMELAVAKGYGEMDDWYETDVYSLSFGPWASTLVEMWAELELAQQRRRVETETVRIQEQASRIKLG